MLDPTQSGLAVNEVIFKRHAACFGTHSCIDAIQRLRRDHGFQANDIAEVGIQASDDILSMCNIAVPQTGLEGKFSLRFTAALALAGADTSHLSFTDAAVTDPRFISLRDKVTVVASDESDQTTRVRITLKNGQSLTAEGDLYKPAGDDELADQWETLVTKFCGLSIPVIGESTTKHIVEVITHLDEIESMRELTRLL